MEEHESPSRRKALMGLLALILASVTVVMVGFAAAYRFVEVRKNEFYTGELSINLNDGQAVITQELFEPGMTVERRFFVRNEGTGDFYYRLYFEDSRGDLAQAVEVTFLDAQGQVFQSGLLSQMDKRSQILTARELSVGQEEWITVQFHFPPHEGNEHQAQELTFRLSALAVQKKNNPDKEFS